MATLPVTITHTDGSTRTEDGRGNVISRTSAPSKSSSGSKGSSSPGSNSSGPAYSDYRSAGGAKGTGHATYASWKNAQNDIARQAYQEKYGENPRYSSEMKTAYSLTQAQYNSQTRAGNLPNQPARALPPGAQRIGNSRIKYKGATYNEQTFYDMQARGQQTGIYDAPNKAELVYKSKISGIIQDEQGYYNPTSGKLTLFAPEGSSTYNYIAGVVGNTPKGYVAEKTEGGFMLGMFDYSQGQSGYTVVKKSDSPLANKADMPSVGEIWEKQFNASSNGEDVLSKSLFGISAITKNRESAAIGLGFTPTGRATTGKEATGIIGMGLMDYSLKGVNENILIGGQSGIIDGSPAHQSIMQANPAKNIRNSIYGIGEAMPKRGTVEWEERRIRQNISGFGKAVDEMPGFSYLKNEANRWKGDIGSGYLGQVPVAGQITANYGAAFLDMPGEITKLLGSGAILLGEGAGGQLTKGTKYERLNATAADNVFKQKVGGAADNVVMAGSLFASDFGGNPVGAVRNVAYYGATEAFPLIMAGASWTVGLNAAGQGVKSLGNKVGNFRETIGGIEYGMTYRKTPMQVITNPNTGERLYTAFSPTADISLSQGKLTGGKVGGKPIAYSLETPIGGGFYMQRTTMAGATSFSDVKTNIVGPGGKRLFNWAGGYESPNVVQRGLGAPNINKIGVADSRMYGSMYGAEYADDLARSTAQGRNIQSLGNYGRAMDYMDDAIGQGASVDARTNVFRDSLDDLLANPKTTWKAGQAQGFQFGEPSIIMPGAEPQIFSATRPSSYTVQSYTANLGKNNQLFLGNLKTPAGVMRFEGVGTIGDFGAAAPYSGPTMREFGLLHGGGSGLNQGIVKVTSLGDEIIESISRPITPSPNMFNAMPSFGGKAIAETTSKSLNLFSIPTASVFEYNVQDYDGAFAQTESPIIKTRTISGFGFSGTQKGAIAPNPIIEMQRNAPIQFMSPFQGSYVGGWSGGKQKNKIWDAEKIPPIYTTKPIVDVGVKPFEAQMGKMSPLTKMFDGGYSRTPPPPTFNYPPPWGEAPPPKEPLFGGGFGLGGFPDFGGSMFGGGNQPKGYAPSLGAIFTGSTTKKAPKGLVGLQMRPIVSGKKSKLPKWGSIL